MVLFVEIHVLHLHERGYEMFVIGFLKIFHYLSNEMLILFVVTLHIYGLSKCDNHQMDMSNQQKRSMYKHFARTYGNQRIPREPREPNPQYNKLYQFMFKENKTFILHTVSLYMQKTFSKNILRNLCSLSHRDCISENHEHSALLDSCPYINDY